MNLVNWRDPNNIEVVRSELNKTPDNLKSAFERIAKRLKCSVRAVSCTYYKRDGGLRQSLKVFTLQSKESKFTGLKNTVRLSKSNGSLIHESVISSVTVGDVRVETIRRIMEL